jgi:hypothetical protein
LIFCTSFVRNIFRSKKNWARYDQNVYRSSCKVPLFLSHLIDTCIFSIHIGKIIKLHENPSNGAELFHADGRTDRRDEAKKTFSQFCKCAPKNGLCKTWKHLRFVSNQAATATGTSRSDVLAFMLPCIVTDFFLNNQPDALIVQIYSVIELYIFRASSLPIIRSFASTVRMERSSVLTVLGSGHQNLHETYQCRMYSRKLLMMGKEVARNM